MVGQVGLWLMDRMLMDVYRLERCSLSIQHMEEVDIRWAGTRNGTPMPGSH